MRKHRLTTQIREVARTRRTFTEIELRAPMDGFVVARNVVAGMRFEKNTELFRIADLRRVWIVVDVFENEARYIRPGAAARVSLPHQDKVFRARVSDVLPPYDSASRTLKVRLEADNPDYALRPDMFADVEVSVRLPAAITLPVDSVLDSGLRKSVYIDMGDGHFAPRRVETGWRLGDRVQILEGLSEGEKVVIAGNFLLDSESRLRGTAIAEFNRPIDRDPVCGMNLDPAAHAAESSHQGKNYHFCSNHCKASFDRNPEHFTRMPQIP